MLDLSCDMWDLWFFLWHVRFSVMACELFLSCSTWDLISWPETGPGPPALGAWSLGHWTSREALVTELLTVIFPHFPRGTHILLVYVFQIRWFFSHFGHRDTLFLNSAGTQVWLCDWAGSVRDWRRPHLVQCSPDCGGCMCRSGTQAAGEEQRGPLCF